MDKGKLPVTKENIVILLLCLGIVAVFCGLWLLPASHRFKTMAGELPFAEAKVREIAQVISLNDELDKQIAALEAGRAAGLPEKVEPLRVEDASAFLDQLQGLARDHGLAKQQVSLQIIAADRDRGQQLTVNAAFQGELAGIQAFIDRLLADAHVGEVGRIELSVAKEGLLLRIDFNLQLT
ncbi:MAG: hypothetical protein AB1568_11280 [Thermodesulfobacteriota bacterium]